MSDIYVYTKFCRIENETDFNFLQFLDSELSFKIQGAEYTAAYRGYFVGEKYVKWDGMEHLLKNDLTFPIGLLQKVKDLYKKFNKEINLIDKRGEKSPSCKIDISSSLKEMGKNPYPYQYDIVKATEENDVGIIKAATGAGKSLCIAMIVANFGKTAIVYVIGKDLLYQMHSLFENIFKTKIGIIGDGHCEIADINIVSIWSLGQALGLKGNSVLADDLEKEKSLNTEDSQKIKDLLKRTKVHIFDECHLAACNTIQVISRNINPEHIYGLSGSPWRDDGADLLIEGLLGKRIVDISATYLINNGFLVRPTIKFLKVPPYPTKLKRNYQSIYQKYIVENEVRNEMVFKGAQRLVEQGYQTLVLYNKVAHGQYLYNKISKHIPCAILSGKDSSAERDKVKKQLENREINCILASKIFDIGVDIPSLSGLVVASGGKSSVRVLQRIGRIIRSAPNKVRAAAIDFYDQAHFLDKHSIIRKEVCLSESAFDVHWPKS